MPSSASSKSKATSSPPPKKGLLRSLLKILMVLLLAGGIAVAFLDLNSFRDPIVSTLSRTSGMEVGIHSLSLDWSGGLGFRAEGLSVAMPETGQRLFSADSLFLKVQLRSLLEGRIEVEEAVIFRPVLDWSAPTGGKAPEKPAAVTPIPVAPSPKLLPRLREVLNRLELEARTLRVKDAELLLALPPGFHVTQIPAVLSFEFQALRPGGQRLDLNLNDLDLRAGPLKFEGSLKIEDVMTDGAHLKIALTSAPRKLSDVRDEILQIGQGAAPDWVHQIPNGQLESAAFNGTLPLTVLDEPEKTTQRLSGKFVALASGLVLQSPQGMVPVQQLTLQARGGGGKWEHQIEAAVLGGSMKEEGSVLLPVQPEKETRIQGTTQWNGLDLAFLPGNRPGWPLQGILQGKASFKQETRKAIELDGQFSVSNLVLSSFQAVPSMKLGFPQVDGTFRHSAAASQANLKGKWLQAPFQLEAQVAAEKGRDIVQGKLQVAGITPALAAPLLAGDWEAQRGEAKAFIQFKGPAAKPAGIHAQGHVEGTDWMLVSRKDPAFEIPLNRVEAPFKWDGTVLNLPKTELHPPHGRITVKAGYKVPSKQYQSEFDARGLRVEDFYRKNVDGDLKFEGALSGRILEKASPAQGVSGKVYFQAANGRFYELDALKGILTVLNPLSVPKLNQKGLPYKSLEGHFNIQEGVAATDDFRLLTDEMKIYLEGYADLPRKGINMKGRFQPSQMVDKTLRQIPILGDILTGGKKGGLIETRFRLTGPLQRPKVTIDAAGSVLGKGTDMLKEIGKVPEKAIP